MTPVHPHLTHLNDSTDVDRIIEESRQRPVLVFKHSRSCGVSHEALEELIAHLDEKVAGVSYAIVTVQTHREASNAIAARLGVRHHTPQAILIRNGHAAWHASHFRVTAAELRKALDAHRQDGLD